jgi:hypothetical protein
MAIVRAYFERVAAQDGLQRAMKEAA